MLRFLSLTLLLLSACVTINVYFPAAAAEKAADEIIDQVYGPKSAPTESPSPNSKLHHLTPLDQFLNSGLNILIAPAYAQANIDITSPKIQSLTNKMAKRHQNLLDSYDNGAIGLTADALIAVRDLTLIPLKSRKSVTNWVAEENQDRLALYREIAIANHHPEWESEIRATFAKRWIERASKSWWYQTSQGKWEQR